MKKVYYQLIMKQKSPLRIGNGDNELSDSDLMRDGRNLPFIPGSSLAGVLRDQYIKMTGADSKAIEKLFGRAENDNLVDSRVLVSDAVLAADCTENDIRITVRDGVGLDEWGMAIHDHKYDFEVVETAKSYLAVLEWTGNEADCEIEIRNGFDKVLATLSKDGLYLGARTTRGYGKMEVSIRKKEFNFPAQVPDWLKFSPFSKTAFKDSTELNADTISRDKLTIVAKLKMEGAFSVKVNTARIERLEDGSVPDSKPLTNLYSNPVIPGTSWAGVFRHHMLRLMREFNFNPEFENEINLFFGMSDSGRNHKRSQIRFSETEIKNGNNYVITRNAVDRYTQAPKNSALFTTMQCQGGDGELVIEVNNSKGKNIIIQLLAATLFDLNLGLVTVGGEATVGRGICKITNLVVNDDDRTESLKQFDNQMLEVKADGI